MLYLEDFLEMIEQLPQDLRDRFTEMRELDLKVQNAADTMEGRFRQFFALAKKNKPEWRDEQFKQIKDEYKKIVDEADEKVVIANQLHDLVERYLKRLDIELSKFKLELEADSAGITEILEQNSLLLDQTPVPSPVNQPSHSHGHHHHHSHKRKASRQGDDHYSRGYSYSNSYSFPLSPNGGGSSSSYYGSTYNGGGPSASQSHHSHQHPSKMARTLSHSVSFQPDDGSQVTASPQPTVQRQLSASGVMQDSHGRRGNAALKLSYQNQGNGSSFIATVSSQAEPVRSHSIVGTIGSMSNVGSGTSTGSSTVTASGIATVPVGTAEMKQQSRKKTARTVPPSTGDYPISNSTPSTPSGLYQAPDIPSNDSTTSAVPGGSTRSSEVGGRLPEGTIPVTDVPPPWTEEIDPNEPRYCLCNQYSYGEMVACDNMDCPIEWFHYGCVGITEPPKGKWYCPQCTQLRRRGRNR